MGQLWRVQPGRIAESSSARRIDPECVGMLTGVEVDEQGRVFVGMFNFGLEYGMQRGIPASGILRVTRCRRLTCMTLPEIAMPNELDDHDGCCT